jgi:hypothetical protein
MQVIMMSVYDETDERLKKDEQKFGQVKAYILLPRND